MSCDTFVDVPPRWDGVLPEPAAGAEAMSDEHQDLSGATGPAWGARESGAILKSFDATGRFLLVFEAGTLDGGTILAAEIGLRNGGDFDIVHDREGGRIFAYEAEGLGAFIKAGPLRADRLYGDEAGPASAEAIELFHGFRATFPQVEAIAERLVEIHRLALAKAMRELRDMGPIAVSAADAALADERLRDWADQIAPERLPPGLRRNHALLTVAGRTFAERAAALLGILEYFQPAEQPKERSGPKP